MADEESTEKAKEFLEYVVKAFVDHPEKVKVHKRIDPMGTLLELEVDPADMGKVVGKEGKTINALRVLLRVLGAKLTARLNLKIVEPGGGSTIEPSESSGEGA